MRRRAGGPGRDRERDVERIDHVERVERVERAAVKRSRAPSLHDGDLDRRAPGPDRRVDPELREAVSPHLANLRGPVRSVDVVRSLKRAFPGGFAAAAQSVVTSKGLASMAPTGPQAE